MATPMTGQLSQNKLGQKLGEKKKGTNWRWYPPDYPLHELSIMRFLVIMSDKGIYRMIPAWLPKTGGNSRPVGRPGWFLPRTRVIYCPGFGVINHFDST